MPDREKVLRGLEVCSDPKTPCEECPYYANQSECSDILCREAHGLLKNSVPKDVFLEVLRKFESSETGVIWDSAVDIKAAKNHLRKVVKAYKQKAGIEDA